MKQLTDAAEEGAKEIQDLSDAFYKLRCLKCRGLGTKRHHAKCPLRGAKTVMVSYVMYPGSDGLSVSEVMSDGHTERVV